MDWVNDFFDGPFFNPSYEAVNADSERTANEVSFIRHELELTRKDDVLDIACGAGRHALLLAGYVNRITGVDRTKSLITEAEAQLEPSNISNVKFQLLDIRKLDFKDEFSAAYNYFTSWGYYDDQTNFDVLARICRALKPGGKFLIEMVNRDALMKRYQSVDWSELEDGLVMLYKRWFDFETGRNYTQCTANRNGETSTITIDHYLPTADALARHLVAAGFGETRAVAAPAGGPLSLDTFRMAVIATK